MPAETYLMQGPLISKLQQGRKLHSCTQGPANVDAIGLLVELGANLWSVMKDADMETPLHMASRSGRLDIVEKLLRCGADYSKKTKVRAVPCSTLHVSCMAATQHAPSKPEPPSVLCQQNWSL